MSQEMTFGQALDWMSKDNSRVVCEVGSESACSRLQGDILQYNAFGVDEDGWCVDNQHLKWKLNVKWRPYVAPKPKSVIEEAIEREMGVFSINHNWLISEKGVELIGKFARNIANLALDEAKKAACDAGGELCDCNVCNNFRKAIDALKVTL